ncbi:PREDICTED: purine permease 1-like [Lupinus angustifolius]|nr:PREDICTED: purine permease 1-like [Lupinus angustifolius]
MAEVTEAEQEKTMKRILLIISCTMLAIGTSGGPIMIRLYFLHGGHRVWLCSFLESGGFPIILIPLFISYIRRRRSAAANQSAKIKMVLIEPPLFFASLVIGLITGLSTFFFAFGVSRLPVTTSSLILATQLVFNALFSFLLVKQKFRVYSVNTIVLLTIAAGILALHSSGDRPSGETSKKYLVGFIITVLVALLDGFIFPVVELAYKKVKQTISYTLVLEVQFVMCTSASLFSIIGMIVNNDFKLISSEARQFEHGAVVYGIVLVTIAVLFQFLLLGGIGVVFCASSLLSGVIIAAILPVTEILAVIFFKEKFNAEKGVALILSLWGFATYFYGETKQAKKMKKNLLPPEAEVLQVLPVSNA